jgi:transketolase
MPQQRDIFLTELLKIAKNDKNVVLISADMGAPALDLWRTELPEQFFVTGISEQNTINFAAGLSAQGKNVFVYFMACWCARCFEQIRYSCAIANNPITILGCGVALGYVPSGPAHEPTEDIAYMRSLCDIEIYSPLNNEFTKNLINAIYCENRKLRYIRLEREYPRRLDDFYTPENPSWNSWIPITSGISLIQTGTSSNTCLISSGYLIDRALKINEMLKNSSRATLSIIDVYKIAPINHSLLYAFTAPYNNIITLEEQTLSGGFGSAICEAYTDLGVKKNILRLGLPQRYIFDNGTREEVLNANGLSLVDIYNKIDLFTNTL